MTISLINYLIKMIKQHCIGSGRDCDRSTINLCVADSDT